MHAECTQAYKLHLTYLSPEVSWALAGDVLMATGPEPTVPEAYGAYKGVFSEVDYESILTHGL